MARLAAAVIVCSLALPVLAEQARDQPANTRRGTGSISGVVVSDDTPARPLRRARVTLNGSSLEVGRTAITYDDGSFEFGGLPPGHYTVGATKESYVTVNYGARRPNRPGAGLALRHDEHARISLALPRGAVLTGTILDPEGLPAQGVRVVALAWQFVRGPDERRLTPIGTAAPQTTDDRGTFRIFGLPAGDYVVAAMPHSAVQFSGEVQVLTETELRRALSDVRAGRSNARPGLSPPRAPATQIAAEKRRTVGLAPMYFPGTTMLARATVVSVAAGEERFGLDFQLHYVPTTTVEGLVAVPPGANPGAGVILFPNERGGPSESVRSGRAAPDGRFQIRGVPPGEYTLQARASMPGVRTSTTPPGPVPPVLLHASTDIVVDSENAPEVVLNLQPGLTLSGTVVLDGGPPPALFGPLRVPVALIQPGTNATFAIPPVQIDAEGRFSISGLPPGQFKMLANLPGVRTPLGRWWLKSAVVDGRDLLDAGLDLRQSSSNAVLTFSSRASVLTGVVRDEAGNAAEGTHVIVFSTHKATWFPNSRRIAAAKPSADGRFTFRNLPPGEYFILAEDDVEPGEWFDAVWLEQVVARAGRLTLGPDEQKSHDITVATR